MRTPARTLATALPTTAALVASLALLIGAAQAASPRDPSGTWLTGDGRARIKVERCGTRAALVCGTVVWLKSPLTGEGRPRTDLKNPDPARRARPVIGMPIMSELAPEDGKFKGEIDNAEEGRNDDVWIGLQGANERAVEGCVLGFLCGSQTWTRVIEAPAQASAAALPAPAAVGSRGARPAPATASAAKVPPREDD